MEPLDVFKIIQPAITASLIHDAVLKALLSQHPDRAAVRAAAESLLMQAQSRLALSDAAEQLQTNVLDGRVQQALDSLFQEPIVLPPDGD